jgi:GMP synthase-like glutamine amidotransferase
MYDGMRDNRGIPAITRLVEEAGRRNAPVDLHRYDVRGKGEVPGLDYDLYIASGGPGSPYDGAGTTWESDYFRWLDALWNYNERSTDSKPALFICHSFQMFVRFFEVAEVTKRRSESFGIFPVHPTAAGRRDPLLRGLSDPFFAADFRHWQAVEIDDRQLEELGGTVLAREKERPAVHLERAVMGLRIGDLAAVQFHPEAEPDGMFAHFRKPKRRRQVVDKVGKRKYQQILQRLNEPDFLQATHNRIVPQWLDRAMESRVRAKTA